MKKLLADRWNDSNTWLMEDDELYRKKKDRLLKYFSHNN
jgi:hypothetical protein|tara:strand:- start:961 stop:1077 length:117 start_codon:yes stop_codon:yes gene_type:complete